MWYGLRGVLDTRDTFVCLQSSVQNNAKLYISIGKQYKPGQKRFIIIKIKKY